MLKNSKSLTIGIVTLVIIAAFSFILLKGQNVEAQAPAASSLTATAAKAGDEQAKSADLLAAPADSKIDVKAAMEERVIGKDDAPVTIIEYASLTCPHCAHFATTILPELKKQLLDTGKAKLIYRDFPFDQFALKAAMLAHCVPKDNYFQMVELLFTKQDEWTKAKEPLTVLQQFGSLAGVDGTTFKSCTENKELETAILDRMKQGQDKYKIEGTPTFVIEKGDATDQFVGAQPVSTFEASVNKVSGGK